MKIQYVYRLDTRGPEIVLRDGITGSPNDWDNQIYGNNTVYTAKSVLGLISYAMERILGRSGERVEQPSYQHSIFPDDELFRDCPVYAYQIDIRKLEHIEVTTSLGFTYPRLSANMHYESFDRWTDMNLKSPLIAEYLKAIHPSERYFFCEARASYAMHCARYTEEVIVRGPIAPKRIRLYQTLPVAPIGRRVASARAHRQ